MISEGDKMRCSSWLGDKNKPIRFWEIWNHMWPISGTINKLFSLAEVRALPSAIIVVYVILYGVLTGWPGGTRFYL